MIILDTVSFATNDVKIYFAGAGAGKTSALINEMTELLKTYRPDEIAFVTYTKKGVAHGRERARLANPGIGEDDLPYFKTLHSLCFKELGLTSENVIDKKEDLENFNRPLGYHITLSEAFENQTEDDKLLIRYNALRSGCTKGAYVHGIYNETRYSLLIKAYEEFKAVTKKVDYYDCLSKFCELNKPINVKVAFIDEAQDLTLLQWEVCKIAFSLCEKIIIAGDDYQTIFSHSGSLPGVLINLANRYKTVKIEKSYRLPEEVYKFTRGITGIITDKVEKDYKPVKNVKGFVEDVSDREFLSHKVKTDFALNGYQSYRWYYLFRNNCFIEKAAKEFSRLVIPYHTHNGFCLNARSLAKIKKYYNFRKNGYASKEVFNKFCKDNKIEDINAEFYESNLIPGEERFAYHAYVEKYGVDALIEMANKEPFLLLSTTHKVKGGEADYVAVFLDCTKKTFQNQQVNIDEELRVFYVACSRAKLGLYLVQSESKYNFESIVAIVKERVA